MALKEVWPGYETVERIGKGGYGTVYKVRKKDTAGEFYSAVKKISIPKDEDEYYALKDEDYTDENITLIFEKRMNKIIEEFKLMAKFRGMSHIVSYEDHMIVAHENGIGWDILIRMELLENLKKHFKNMDKNDVIKLGLDMCEALEIIQKENIVHRDIKPENILVNAYGQYKLSDFGIARTMDHVTKATLAGTPDYIAPEVFHKQAYGFLADEYSLGLVLYWTLNERRMPFVEINDRPPTDEEMQEAQKRRLEGEVLPEPLNGSVLLKKAVLKACAYKPEDRYQTITEFKKALQLCDMADIPEEEIPTEEIEEKTEIDSETFSETIGAWGRTEVKEETPVIYHNVKQEEVPVIEETAEEARLNTVANLLREYSFSKNELLRDELKTCITPYESYLIGLGFALKANIVFTENNIGKVIQYADNRWTITFAEQGIEYVTVNMPKDIDTAIYWLTSAANHNEYRAMAALSFIYECDKKDLQHAKLWMHKACVQTNNMYYEEQLERQTKTEKGENKLDIFKKYLPKLEGKSSFAPYPDLKLINTLRKGYSKSEYQENEVYRKSGTEDILDNQEILAVYYSKVNWSIPRVVLVFTKEETVCLCPKFIETTPGRKHIDRYHLPYERLRPVEVKDSGELCMRDYSGNEYQLGYNPRNVDGQILFQLFSELSSIGFDLNLQMQAYLQKINEL